MSAAELYVILDREFRRQQAEKCRDCYITLPFRVDRNADDDAPNWELMLPVTCPEGCADLLDRIISRMGELYELLPDGADRVRDEP